MSKTMHGFPVINIDKINWNDEFDTLILGHLEELELKTKKDYGALLIKRCLEMQKNIVLFDSAFSEERNNLLSSAKAVKVYYPDNNRVLNNISRMENKLFSFATPILAVLGTSSKQGKMSLQLDLRRLFMNAGYIIGQFGTEPSSMLFGFDEVYVMGYNSNCSHDSEKNILSINSLIHNIDMKHPDLIIAGTQSHTIPSSYYNVGQLPTYQQDFLLGVLPDACLLCVNEYDDATFVSNTIQYIESLASSQVIAIIVSPINNSPDGALEEKESTFSKQIYKGYYLVHEKKYPVFYHSDINELFDWIISWFST